MAHRPMYCSNAVGDGCENHENAVSNPSDILLFEQLPVILIDLLVDRYRRDVVVVACGCLVSALFVSVGYRFVYRAVLDC